MFFINISKAQDAESFQIISASNSEEIAFYKKAIENANLELYRCRTENDTLLFESGVSVVLFSAESLKRRGVVKSIENYKNRDERGENYIQPIFKVTTEGFILAPHKVVRNK